jgi:hypothetical protein
MSNDTKYIDKNGNDTRYGIYYFDDWLPDPPEIIELKKSGEWDKMSHLQKKWMFQDCCRPGPGIMDEVIEHRRSLSRKRRAETYKDTENK